MCLISVPRKMVERQQHLYYIAVRYLIEQQYATVGAPLLLKTHKNRRIVRSVTIRLKEKQITFVLF
jgi:hypothetical protein